MTLHARSLLLVAALLAVGEATAAAGSTFAMSACQSGECVYSRISDPVVIARRDNGVLTGATVHSCVERRGKYPADYRCQRSSVMTTDMVAFCSRTAPSIAVKEHGKWSRTRLSISEDGEYGYNREYITDYLRICHGYARTALGAPSLDIIGAKYGYRSRYDKLGDGEHDVVSDVLDLVE